MSCSSSVKPSRTKRFSSSIKRLGEVYQSHECLLNRGAVLFGVIFLDNLLILLVEVDARWIAAEHGIKTLLDEFVNVRQDEILTLGLRKFFAEHIEVNGAYVKLTCSERLVSG